MSFDLLRRRKDLPLSHARLITLALLAVLLPAVVLLILQYRSLSDVEHETRIAVQENLRETAEGVAWSVRGDMERVAEEILLPVPPRFFEQKQAPWTQQSTQEVFRKYPEIKQIFLVVDDPQNPCANVAYVYSPGRACKLAKPHWDDLPDIQQAIAGHQKADLLFAASAPGDHSRFCYWQDSESDQQEAAYVSYCLIEPGTPREVGFVGFRLDMAAVRQSYLPQLVSNLSRSQRQGPGAADLILQVLDKHGRQIYSSSGRGAAGYSARASLAPVFPQWEATAGFQTTDVDALARASFEKGLWFTVLVVAVLLAGIAMIVRGSVRELKLAEVKQTFVSNVSHELKTPLALIRLFAETLEMGRVKSHEKAQEYYRIIYNESRRLSQLIDNILDFSRIEAGSREYNFVSVDLAETARAVVDSYEYQIRAAGFELETSLDRDVPRVHADPDAISQAILNLLNNAVKYSDGTKQIRVSVHAKNGGAIVEVADRGIGIPLSEQKRIFEKFYRVSTGLVHETKGSGLGLALVKHIVEAHQGHVSVESAPGKGSRFTVWLPALVQPVSDHTEPAGEGDLVAQSADHRG